ncbi:MAG: 16S rRNA (guanine(966)-N(2))-methyltransferase RsmD [Pseudomonadota bacterium]
MSRQARGRAGGRDNRFRIIGGHHRGRRLSFPDLPSLRPSPDRVRETLFNWLGPSIVGARCADVFAGSGALGLEALSRGAVSCRFIDQAPQAIEAIEAHLQVLGLADGMRATCSCGDVEDILRQGALPPMDLYFVDPPFHGNHWDRLCTLLDESLAGAIALVYLEHPVQLEPTLPPGWQLLKSSRAGRVGFRLARTVTATTE